MQTAICYSATSAEGGKSGFPFPFFVLRVCIPQPSHLEIVSE